jgi:nitroreductase
MERTFPLEDVMSDDSRDLFEIMQTTRSMRRLKSDPVPNALIRKILEAGVSAPSGGNMQRWRFLVIRDPKVKQTIGAYYKRAWDEVVSLVIVLANQRRARAASALPGCSTRPNFSTIQSMFKSCGDGDWSSSPWNARRGTRTVQAH